MKKKENNDLIIAKNPKSRFAESIKTIRTNIAFSNVDKENKVILITSCEPGDGKSFISASLAAAYSQEGKNVLLIDCDLRRGRQHEIFAVPNGSKGGYSNLILKYKAGENKHGLNVKDYIATTAVKRLSLIVNGPVPPNPTELLSSKNNEALLEKVREMYDIIILDCPPVVGLSDAAIMTKYSDINLLVVSCGKTKIELVDRAKKTFQNVNANLSGVVLNKINAKGTSYGSYYSDKYYGE